MTEQHVLRGETAVGLALNHNDLVPPQAGSAVGCGRLAQLRADMARFSSGDAHTIRRRSVESAIDRISLVTLAQLAVEEANAALVDGISDADSLAARVPTRAVARSLGARPEELSSICRAVEVVAEVIGRGHPADDDAEQQCGWLLGRFADHPDGAVAAVSVLYQNRDATAALLLASVAAETTGTDRRPAVRGTVRQVVASCSIGEHDLTEGELVRLEFTSTEQEFGTGAHRCPGEAMAHTLVDSILSVR